MCNYEGRNLFQRNNLQLVMLSVVLMEDFTEDTICWIGFFKFWIYFRKQNIYLEKALYCQRLCNTKQNFHCKGLFFTFENGKFKPIKSSSFYTAVCQISIYRKRHLKGVLFLAVFDKL